MKRIIITIIFSVAITVLIAQTSDRNYVKTVTYLDSNGSGCITNIQYYDGLGRPDVSVTGGANTSGKYLYSFQTYDGCGRAETVWSPVAGGTTPDYQSLSEIQSLSQNLYGDNYGYSTTIYDALDRPIFVTTPGSAWVGKGKSTTYGTNAANEVKKYNASSMPNFTYYSKNTLACTQTMDEDGHTAKTYKDLFGNVVLERRIDGNTNFDTYYVYNSLNQLAYVLQPMFQEEDDLGKFAFQYTYDERGRMKTKTIPGCDPVEYWYDNADRVVKMQDGILRDSLRYRVYEYDALGRMKKQSISNGKKTLYDEIINFYDTYDFIEECDDVLPYDYSSLYPYSDEDYGWSMLTGTRQLASNGEVLLTTYGYDDHGRIISEIRVGLNNHYTSLETNYDFAGNVQYQWFDEYEYDWDDDCIDWCLGNRWGDIENKYNSKNNNLLSSTLLNMYSNNADGDMTSITDTINNLTYDILGKVTKNDRSGTSGDMSYSYDNLHGWLTQIKANSKYGGFEQNLYRETGGSKPCYNGSISAMTWKNISDYLRRYDYEYDGLNRLTNSAYSYSRIGKTTSGALVYTLIPADRSHEDYSVSYEYDKNTNISSVVRSGRVTIQSVNGYDVVEEAPFEHIGNQLKKVDPWSAGEPYYNNFDFVDGIDDEVEYVYDHNGNLIEDRNKGLTFSYDLLGHLTKVSSETADIEYVYAADGTKLQVSHKQYTTSSKTGTPKTSTSETYYGNLIYKNGNVSSYNFDGGFLSFNSKGSLYQSSCHLYIKDYQGNNRMLVNAYNNGIEQNTHYYPYGGLISDIGSNPDGQDYKYGGKELDRTYGLDLYDFHARQLDSKLGCFTSIDPLAEKYYGISPYAYCAGDPINRVDVNGQEWKYVKNPDGSIHIMLDVTLINDANLTNAQLDAYKNAINSTFCDMLSAVPGGRYSGEITFNGNQVEGQVTPILTLTEGEGGAQAGQTKGLNSYVYVTNENGYRSTNVIASDAIHELLHTAMLDDITTTIVASDVSLTREGNMYFSTISTTPDILSNIMNSPSIIINGQRFMDLYEQGTQNRITKGQVDFLINQIDLLRNGAGTKGPLDPFWIDWKGIPL